jgi:pimeloyl-ACP methyl ester carboxylesterase
MSSPSFEKIYAGVASDQVQELIDFRNSHPYLSFQSNGKTWRYQQDGRGERVILFLPGGLQSGEAWLRYMNHFKNRCRVLSITYPDDANRIDDVIDALEKLSEIEQLEALSVIGTSLGGMINQVFIRRCPERITHLVIANTSHPDPQYAKRLLTRLLLARVIPISFLHYLTKKRLAQYGKSSQHKTKHFYDAYLIEHNLYYTTRAWIINHYSLIIDFCMRQQFTPANLVSWGGKLLLVESEDDLFPESTRAALRGLYPQAPVYRFGKGAGHSPSVVCEEEYRNMLEDFLEIDHLPYCDCHK